jgi:hypothetical protein
MSNENSSDELTKEQQILRVMRKVLANVVKDTTPAGGRPNPLTDSTIQDIRECFGLIAARERELAELLGLAPMRPFYPGEEPTSKKVVKLVPPSKKDTQ